MHISKHAKITTAIVLSPIVLIVLAAVALYVPPIQKWAVDKACAYAGAETGMDVGIEGIHLAFPLDLSLEGVHCTQKNDSLPQVTDTIANIGKAIVDVELLPLMDGDIHINAIELCQSHINTAEFIHTTRIKGYVGRLMIDNDDDNVNDDNNDNQNRSVASVALHSNVARIGSVILDDAHLNIEISDTVPEDTTTSETFWKISVKMLSISNSSMVLHMPGDTLQIGATLKDVKARQGYFDLSKGLYNVSHLAIEKSAFTYDNNFEPAHRLKGSVLNGFDTNHLAFTNINISSDSIHYQTFDAPTVPVKDKSETTTKSKKTLSDIYCRIMHASMKEQSGLTLNHLTAVVKIDSTALQLTGALATPISAVALDLKVKPNVIDSIDLENGMIDAKINASLGRQDLMVLAFADMPAAFRKAWPQHPLNIRGEIHGHMRQASIPYLSVELPTAFSLEARGEAKNFLALTRNIFSRQFSASLHGDLKTYNMAFVKTFLDPSTAKTIDIPAMRAIADISANGPDYDLTLKASEGKGRLTADAKVNIAAKNYSASIKARNLNLGQFIKGKGLGVFTGTLSASGKGTNILANTATVNAKAAVQQFRYGQYDLSGISGDVALHNGKVDLQVDAQNQLLNGKFSLSGILGSRFSDITLVADLHKADLYHLKIAETPLEVALCGHLDIETNMNDSYKVQGMVSDITIADTAKAFHPDDIVVDILTRKDTTKAFIDCGDFSMRMNAQGSYKWLMGCGTRMKTTLETHFKERTINQDDIRLNLPNMTLTLKSGQNNPIARLLKYFDVQFSHVDLSMHTSREDGIFTDFSIGQLTTQGYQLDTITAKVTSKNDPKEIFYNLHIQNSPPNAIVFDAYVDGQVLPHGLDINAKLYDDKHQLAMQLGAEAMMEENALRLHLTPDNPVLGYQTFTLNNDNFVLLGLRNRVHANVNLLTDHGMGIKIYCSDENQQETGDSTDVNSTDTFLQDITMSINKLDLGRLTASLPYAPNVKGSLNGDLHLMQNQDATFTLSNDMSVENLVYEGCTVGNLGTQFTYFPKTDGSHYVDGIVTKDGNEVATLNGSYNFNTEAVDATLTLDKFPLDVANGLIPEQIMGLEGTAEGNLSVQGTASQPIVNGELYLQDAALLSVPYGVRLRFDNDPVAIHDSKLMLENFNMYAYNNQPLLLYGTVDFTDLDHINLNMRMKAENFQLINAKETVRSEAYGKVFVSCMAGLKGELDKLQMRGRLEVLNTTNLYYILKNSPITTDNTMKELVTFTDLSDTTAITVVKPQIEGMDLRLNVVVDEGAHVKCWLDGSHNNYLDLIGTGDLRMTYRHGAIGMTGRYTVTEGEMKYSLPVIPLKTFTLQEGSYVEWNGELMNPRLNITALETVRSSVNVNGTNQTVTFNTGVKLSKTLNDMGLEFIIEAPENKDVADALSMRSLEERGTLAVTMLTTGMYVANDNSTNLGNSALSSFLQSQINTIAGSALRTIDLSFGMENVTGQDGVLHNDYTFKFAKRFWNNRLSILVGGKISSGPDVSGQNKTFFDNVELQYRLTSTSNKYMQMFYKKSVYDYLEGYLSKFGGGFLWKKKAQTIRDIFRNESSTLTPMKTPAEKNDTLVKFATPANENK